MEGKPEKSDKSVYGKASNPITVISYLSDFMSFLYPKYCNGCKRTLAKGEKCLCSHCVSNLPQTNFHTYENNPIEMVFAGRIPVCRAVAFCFFRQGNIMQNIVHQLKYAGNMEIGIYLGYLFGLSLKENKVFETVDIILPIPLHKKKFKTRGYNQSACIAKGMARALSKPVDTKSLTRIVATSTQTKKTRYARWENISDVFQLIVPEKLAGKHILLVDDIVTTGSTIESAAQQLLTLEDIKISVACLGFAV